MNNSNDEDVDKQIKALYQVSIGKIVRPIEFTAIGKCITTPPIMPVPVLGNCRYLLEPGEAMPIIIVAAIKYKNWIFTVERNITFPREILFMCAFYNETEHGSFCKLIQPSNCGPGNVLIEWFFKTIIPIYHKELNGKSVSIKLEMFETIKQ